jgi:hypothetical protein
LIIRGNDIKLNSVKVVFGNGEVEDIVFNRKIKIPHDFRERRFIREVKLRYHSRPDSGAPAIGGSC